MEKRNKRPEQGGGGRYHRKRNWIRARKAPNCWSLDSGARQSLYGGRGQGDKKRTPKNNKRWPWRIRKIETYVHVHTRSIVVEKCSLFVFVFSQSNHLFVAAQRALHSRPSQHSSMLKDDWRGRSQGHSRSTTGSYRSICLYRAG